MEDKKINEVVKVVFDNHEQYLKRQATSASILRQEILIASSGITCSVTEASKGEDFIQLKLTPHKTEDIEHEVIEPKQLENENKSEHPLKGVGKYGNLHS